VPIPKRSASPRATSTTVVVDGLKVLDPKRPIREADMFSVEIDVCFVPITEIQQVTIVD
jgi:hypothetical protein